MQSMNAETNKPHFPQLPNWVQVKIRELNVSDPETWIQQSIPALGNRSVLEILRTPDGELVLRDYFAKVIGHF
jgi:hypothetical protein